MNQSATRLLVIGGSAGSLHVLMDVLRGLPWVADVAIFVCLHSASRDGRGLAEVLASAGVWPAGEALEHGVPAGGRLYVAGGDYHWLIERDRHFALSYDDPVHFSRPSIDVLLETAAEAYREGVAGVLLSGANADGAHGMARLQAFGGATFVQAPASAAFADMPDAALDLMQPDYVAEGRTLVRAVSAWLMAVTMERMA